MNVALDNSTLVLPPQLCGSVAYYAAMAAHTRVVIADAMRHDKRYKSVHRTVISDPHGLMTLTVPVAHTAGITRWDEVRLSTHGHWWNVHARSLATAYGASPFFEFYIDRFMPMMRADTVSRYVTVTALDAAWDEAIRSALHLDETEVTHSADPALRPDATLFAPDTDIPYWQVTPTPSRAGLSVLDLIFNTGPEAVTVLRDTVRANHRP